MWSINMGLATVAHVLLYIIIVIACVSVGAFGMFSQGLRSSKSF